MSPLRHAMSQQRAHRRRHSSTAFTVAAAALGLAALAGTWVFMQARVEAMASPTTQAIFGLLFWLNAFQVLVFAYTVFEVFFRAPDHQVLAPLPLPPRAWFAHLWRRTLAFHIALLLPGLLLAASLLKEGHARPSLVVLLSTLMTQIAGLPLSAMLHLMAGRSILSGRTDTKQLFASGITAPESAYLFVSPSIAFGGCLVLSLVLSFSLRLWAETSHPVPLALAGGVCAIVALASYKSAQAVFSDCFAQVLPRFAETEIVPPFLERNTTRRFVGLSLAALFPPPTAALFQKDLVQLRRRYRVDTLALAVFLGVCLLLGARTSAQDADWSSLFVATLLMSLIIINPLFRLFDTNLEPPGLLSGLPISAGQQLMAKAAVVLVYQLTPVLLATAIFAVFSQRLVPTLALLSTSVLTLVLSTGLCLAIATRTQTGLKFARWALNLAVWTGCAIWAT